MQHIEQGNLKETQKAAAKVGVKCHLAESLDTPLHLACLFGHRDIVEWLLKLKANPNAGANRCCAFSVSLGDSLCCVCAVVRACLPRCQIFFSVRLAMRRSVRPSATGRDDWLSSLQPPRRSSFVRCRVSARNADERAPSERPALLFVCVCLCWQRDACRSLCWRGSARRVLLCCCFF